MLCSFHGFLCLVPYFFETCFVPFHSRYGACPFWLVRPRNVTHPKFEGGLLRRLRYSCIEHVLDDREVVRPVVLLMIAEYSKRRFYMLVCFLRLSVCLRMIGSA